MNLKQNLKKLIIQNNCQEFISYYIFNNVKVTQLNDTYFDLLTYALEHNASNDILQFIIKEYTQCNYETSDNKIPIYLALSYNRFTIAKNLLNKKADINRVHSNGDNILIYLCKSNKLNKSNLTFALNHQIQINAKDRQDKKIMYYLIHNEYVDLVKLVLEYYIFDNNFILNLIQHKKYRKGLSKQQLQQLITNETQKIDISSSLYFSAI
ncbi:hypothetical protein H8356DRAFT_939787, partial [Neocallimastix lanati (nom. inval.)]